MKQTKRSECSLYWKPIVEEYLNSDFSMREFAKIKNIGPTQLGHWKSKFETMSSNPIEEEKKTNFIPIRQVKEDVKKNHIPDPIWLTALIREIYAIHK